MEPELDLAITRILGVSLKIDRLKIDIFNEKEIED